MLNLILKEDERRDMMVLSLDILVGWDETARN
jgi:hypothetical protein